MIAEAHGRDENALADFEIGNIFADFNNFSGRIGAENMRQVDAGEALPHPNIEMVERACADADEDLIFARLGVGDGLVLEDFRATELVNADGFHGGAPIWNLLQKRELMVNEMYQKC